MRHANITRADYCKPIDRLEPWRRTTAWPGGRRAYQLRDLQAERRTKEERDLSTQFVAGPNRRGLSRKPSTVWRRIAGSAGLLRSDETVLPGSIQRWLPFPSQLAGPLDE